MSAHRTLKDMYRAFEDVGPGRLKDPGSGGTITFDMWGQICSVVTAAAEARTLDRPVRPGILACVVLDTDGGDLTLTVTGGYNADGDTSVTFDDAGDMVVFLSIKTGTTYRWQVIAQEGTNIANLATTPGTGITTGADNVVTSVEKIGTVIRTTILIDIDGLNSGANANDVIGKADTANCHIGQITAARNGTIFAGRMTCIEAPVGGDNDIDLWDAESGTLTEDTDIEDDAGAEDQLTNGGDLSAGTVVPLTAYPTANRYLYLAAGTGDTNNTYTAGILLIELWGRAV